MCGIAGIADITGTRSFDRALVERMADTLAHRGPDEHGLHLAPGIALAHRRLSIIDLSSGQQPMSSDDGQLVVVYNGEIYNFMALRAELSARGHRFATRCDTEVILYAWREWGESCVDHLRGMFAFALWDASTQTVFLARDRLGIKPLYYCLLADGRLIFGSELKALLSIPELQRHLDPTAVEDYLAFGYVPDPKTIFQGVFKLAPGHTATVARGTTTVTQRQYWDIHFSVDPTLYHRHETELAEELLARLTEAVELRLIADVPLGAFLSGGVDSSTVVRLMSERSADPVQTFSISFGDPKFNESRYAEQVAHHCQTRHSVRQVDPNDFALLDVLAGMYDEPFADSSALPTYRVCEMARQAVTVALSGDGGDEGLAGYRRYRWHTYEERLRTRLPLGLRRLLFGVPGRLYPKADWAPKMLRAKATLEALGRDAIEGYFHSVSVVHNRIRQRLYSRSFRHDLQGYHAVEVLRRHADRADPTDPVAFVQYLDFKTYLPGDILTKVDRASMYHSLEVRVPLLDHPLLEWAATLPAHLKLQHGIGKYLLKKAMESQLPNAILYRQKMGFAVPVAAWFRGPLAARLQENLLGGPLAATGIFAPRAVAQIIAEHQRGTRDHGATLWALLMFSEFSRQSLR